LLIRRH